MFDIDGTLTEIGSNEIPISLAKRLAELSLRIPLAFATGRNLNHIIGKMGQILAHSTDPGTTRKNWYVICENGAAGFFYNLDKWDYEEFYRINWDENLINRAELKKALEEALKDLIDSMEMRTTQFLIRPKKEGMTIEEINILTAKITQISREILVKFPNSDQFEVLDSSIAVHISPKNANKDQGIKRFTKFLEEKLGLDTGESARNIMVVGDQAAPGRNDYALLKGDYGTPFTVGDASSDSKWPLQVLNGEKILTGPMATLYLLENNFFNASSPK